MCPSGSLEDEHIWELAQRIGDVHQLLDLGLKVLRIPGFKIQSALTNKKDIELAAYQALMTWDSNQNNRCEAYTNLLSGLRSNGFKDLAGKLNQWVEGAQ